MTDLSTLTASDVAALIARREVSAREVTTATLSRIDAQNPSLNAIVQHMSDEALATADAIDAALRRGEAPGPLAGVPITIKVNVDQTGHATTNGLVTQKDMIAAEDSPVIANLRRAGAVIVGRTNTPAFSLRWFTRNGLHGATKNPHDAGLTPGGSSGGAGSAVATGMGAIAHGTDIAGSVRYPAYACGVHGLRSPRSDAAGARCRRARSPRMTGSRSPTSRPPPRSRCLRTPSIPCRRSIRARSGECRRSGLTPERPRTKGRILITPGLDPGVLFVANEEDAMVAPWHDEVLEHLALVREEGGEAPIP
jgi:hypothetical protein